MNLVLLVTPSYLGSKSMPLFATMVGEGMRKRGHSVHYRTPQNVALRSWFTRPSFISKWAGYVDQYLLFPGVLRGDMLSDPDDTLYVVSDQGLGMWVPEICKRPHVVHCHDLLAIRSSRGEFPDRRLSTTGRFYQSRIRSGLAKASNFISVSEATRNSLHSILGIPTGISEVIPNALNRPLSPMTLNEAAKLLGVPVPSPKERPIIHVGGNQWYKNREGVLQIYNAYVATEPHPSPLWMIGREPTSALRLLAQNVPAPGRVIFMTDIPDRDLSAIYSLAALLLFPSLEEGFGWPIAEAMACGCPVITTGNAPMTEVGGNAAVYIPRAGLSVRRNEWANQCASVLRATLDFPQHRRDQLIALSLGRAAGFDLTQFLDRCEAVYRKILASH
jgi:glycosyltransferase involved in cell wall biosynthesis